VDYTGLDYAYTPPSYNFGGDFGGSFNAPVLPDYSFDLTGPMPSFNMPAMPSFDMTSPMGGGMPGYGAYGSPGGMPGIESMIPHNQLSPVAALPPQQPPQPQGGFGGLFGDMTLKDWIKMGGAGAALIPALIGAFQGPQQGVTSTTRTQTPTAPPMGPYEIQALKAAMLGTQAADPRLIEQSFQPQLGSLLQQAIEQARQAGFHTNPLESPVAERIMSQGLADLQGQMAAAKLGQMNYASTLGSNTALGLGANRVKGMGGTTTAQTTGTTPNYWSSLGTGLTNILGSLGGGMGTLKPATYQQPQQQQGLTMSGYR
jgi:hypothetical protein